jgi:hypothetical protein
LCSITGITPGCQNCPHPCVCSSSSSSTVSHCLFMYAESAFTPASAAAAVPHTPCNNGCCRATIQ